MNIQDAIEVKKSIVDKLFAKNHDRLTSAKMQDLIYVPFLSEIYPNSNALSYEISSNDAGTLCYSLTLCSITGHKHCSVVEEIAHFSDLTEEQMRKLHKCVVRLNLSKSLVKIGISHYTQTEENILANVWGSQYPVRVTTFEEIFRRGFRSRDRSFGTLNDGRQALYFNGAKMFEKRNAGQDLWLVTTQTLSECEQIERSFFEQEKDQ